VQVRAVVLYLLPPNSFTDTKKTGYALGAKPAYSQKPKNTTNVQRYENTFLLIKAVQKHENMFASTEASQKYEQNTAPIDTIDVPTKSPSREPMPLNSFKNN